MKKQMKKSVFLLLSLLILSSTSSAHKCPEGANDYPECQDDPSRAPQAGLSIEVKGFSCANPWNGEEGPNFASAMRDADRKANEKCYPFQAGRISEYKLNSDNSICRAYLFGATASAFYNCAQLPTASH